MPMLIFWQVLQEEAVRRKEGTADVKTKVSPSTDVYQVDNILSVWRVFTEKEPLLNVQNFTATWADELFIVPTDVWPL